MYFALGGLYPSYFKYSDGNPILVKMRARNDGVHYVFRHNTIEKDSVVGSLDGHGTYNIVGTRAMEFYANEIIDPIDNFVDRDSNGNLIDDARVRKKRPNGIGLLVTIS